MRILLSTIVGLMVFGAVGTALADPPSPDLTIDLVQGPPILKAGVSGTFTIKIRNAGNASGPLEAFVVFAGKLDQTDQIRTDSGLSCEVRHDKGINAAVRCTGGIVAPAQIATIVVQGRGQAAGQGQLVTTINPSSSLPESRNDNNFSQVNVTIE